MKLHHNSRLLGVLGIVFGFSFFLGLGTPGSLAYGSFTEQMRQLSEEKADAENELKDCVKRLKADHALKDEIAEVLKSPHGEATDVSDEELNGRCDCADDCKEFLGKYEEGEESECEYLSRARLKYSKACGESIWGCSTVRRRDKLTRLKRSVVALESTCDEAKGRRDKAVQAIEDLNHSCPNCAVQERMAQLYKPRDPNGMDYLMMALPSVAGITGMGLGAYEMNHSMNAYSSLYNNQMNAYYGYCNQVGVPCNGAGFGGMGSLGYGMGMGGLGMGMGMMGMPGMMPMGMGMGGMGMMPGMMGMGGMGMMPGMGMGMMPGMGFGVGMGMPGMGMMPGMMGMGGMGMMPGMMGMGGMGMMPGMMGMGGMGMMPGTMGMGGMGMMPGMMGMGGMGMMPGMMGMPGMGMMPGMMGMGGMGMMPGMGGMGMMPGMGGMGMMPGMMGGMGGMGMGMPGMMGMGMPGMGLGGAGIGMPGMGMGMPGMMGGMGMGMPGTMGGMGGMGMGMPGMMGGMGGMGYGGMMGGGYGMMPNYSGQYSQDNALNMMQLNQAQYRMMQGNMGTAF